MKWMLKAKEVVKSFYEKYDKYADGLLKFVFSLSLFLTVMYFAGYRASITKPVLAILLAGVCSLLPALFINVFAAFLLAAEFSAVSLELTLVTLLLFLLMTLLYFVFRAGKSWLLALTMLLLLWNLTPAILPLALLISPAEIIVCVFGILVYVLIMVVRKDISALSSVSGDLTMMERLNLLLTDLFTGNRFLLILSTVCLGMLVIALFRRSRASHAPLLSVVIGGFVFSVAYLLGGVFLNVSVNYVSFGIGTAVMAVISAFILNLVIGMDYKRTEEVRFEDDEYYYFVKAVPKRTITLTERRVENITKDASFTGMDIDMDKVFVRHEDGEGKEEE